MKLKPLKNRGFSLPEVLLAAGIVGGLALIIAKIQQQQTKVHVTSQIQSEVAQIRTRVQNVLLDQESCKETFQPPGVESITTTPTPVPAVKYLNPVTGEVTNILETNKKYGNGRVLIKAMDIRIAPSGEAIFAINFQKLSAAALGSKTVKRQFPIQIVRDDAGNFVTCYSNIQNAINTAVKQSCVGNSTRLVEQPDGSFQCVHDVEPKTCGPGQVLVETIVNTEAGGPNEKRIESTCRDIVDNTNLCLPGEFLAKNMVDGAVQFSCKKVSCPSGQVGLMKPDGMVVCTALSCPVGQVMAGLDTDTGNIRCKAFNCPEGQVGVLVNGDIKCSNMLCNTTPGSRQYLAGFNGKGDKICVNLIAGDNAQCKSGSTLVATPSGELKLECCTPNCGAEAANYCNGELYQAPNGCGTCVGTKPPTNSYPTIWTYSVAGATDAHWEAALKNNTNSTWVMCGESSGVPFSKTVTRTRNCIPATCGGFNTQCSAPQSESAICSYSQTDWKEYTGTSNSSQILFFAVRGSPVEVQMIGGGGGGGGAGDPSECRNKERAYGGLQGEVRSFNYSISNTSYNPTCTMKAGNGGRGGGIGRWGVSGGSSSVYCPGFNAVAAGGGGGSYGAQGSAAHGYPRSVGAAPFYPMGGAEGSESSGRPAPSKVTIGGREYPSYGGGGGGGMCNERKRREGGAGRQGMIRYRYWKTVQFQ